MKTTKSIAEEVEKEAVAATMTAARASAEAKNASDRAKAAALAHETTIGNAKAVDAILKQLGESKSAIADELLQRIKKDPQQFADLARALSPIGTVVAWPGSGCPEGWEVCNGREIDVDDGAKIREVLANRYGNPTTTGRLRLPDFQGRFLRGYEQGVSN